MAFALIKVALIGAGGHARACVDLISHSETHEVAGFVLNEPSVGHVLGFPVLCSDLGLRNLIGREIQAIVAVGQLNSAFERVRLFEMLAANNIRLATLCAESAYVPTSSAVGRGSVIMRSAHLGFGARVGMNCIVNTGVIIEHDCIIGNHCHIAPGAIVNGGVRIGDRSFVGSGAVIRNGVSIGCDCFVGMGTRLTSDIQDGRRIVS